MCMMEYPADKRDLVRVRPGHRVYLLGLVADGRAIATGSFVPDDDGGLFIYEAASLHDAQSLVDHDPYIIEKVVTRYMLREFEVHAVNPRLLRVTG
ncbi:YciI family protein [Paraburkholderia sp. GAS199]|uniref:YciI family protein n=1 Tax=Paraburkholderia sp. GAS199 TaxID=3035126 RepID=UPI003D21460B